MQPVPASRACAATLALLASLLGCGGQAGDASQPASSSSPVPGTTPRTPSLFPQPGGAPSSSGPVPPFDPPPPTPPTPSAFPGGLIPERFRPPAFTETENLLLAYCGTCHGPEAQGPASGGINFIGDVSRLVEAELIVPMSSRTSPIIRVMRDQSMPPPGSGLPPVIPADIETIAAFIDDQRYWPGEPPVVEEDAGLNESPVDAGSDVD